MRMMSRIFVWSSVFVLLAAVLACGLGVWFVLPKSGNAAVGILIEGRPIRSHGSIKQYLSNRAEQLSQRKVQLRVDGKTLKPLTFQQLGVRVDQENTLRRAMEIGRTGGLLLRLDQSIRARRGQVDVPITWWIDEAPLLELVERIKDDVDKPGVAASYDFANKSTRPHKDGTYLDAYGTIEALYELFSSLVSQEGRVSEAAVAVSDTPSTLDLVLMGVPPQVTTSFLANLDISQDVGHFESRFGYLGGQKNRAHNIAHAASRLDGVVLMPGQVLSFNQTVGHRTLENGFRTAAEIFKGEMVEGIGGGSCQVASTLHAAAYLAGLDVVERSPHSRPIGYMGIGLDATVVDGLVDLKLRNPFDFPVVVHSRVDKGTIVFELLGKERPVRVTFRGEVINTKDFERTLREESNLQPGRAIRTQRGIKGYTIRRVREIRYADGRVREEITKDYYPPTPEIYLVPPGTELEDLPPLAGEENASAESSACDQPGEETSGAEPGGPSADCPKRLVVENGPAARKEPPRPSHSVVIQR